MRRFFIFVVLAGLAASLTGDPRFRADDGNLWRLDDNPALIAASGDVLALGASVVPDQGRWDQGTNGVQLISPILAFDYTWKGSEASTLKLGTALGPWQGFSLGYRNDRLTQASFKDSIHHFGALYRPVDFLSTAVTLDDAFNSSRLWGAGVSLRPLTPFFPRGEWLTVSADVQSRGSNVAWERVGARFAWQNSDLRLWYEPGTSVPGFEVTVSLGPSETTVAPNRVGQALRLATSRLTNPILGRVVLRIRDPGALLSTPEPRSPFPMRRAWSLPALVALLDRASENPDVVAVAFEEPPVTGGMASAQDLRQALTRLQASGKKVYIHATNYSDSVGFQGWVSQADRVSLAPTGTVFLVAQGTVNFYFKDFFDKIGLQFVNFAPWETKSANNLWTYSSMPAGEKAQLTRLLQDRQDIAVAALGQGRGARLKGSAAALVAQGPWLVARDSLDRGLVDALENRSDFETVLSHDFPGASLVDDLPSERTPGWGPSVTRQAVAVVHLNGSIILGPGQAGRSIGRAAAETVAALRKDGEVRAIVLRVNSPGGAVPPSDDLADEVKKTVAAGKPVVVVMGDVAASGGYYISAPASRIFAQPGTITGSIGVTAAFFNAEKSLQMLGIRADRVDTAASAAFGDFTRPISEEDKSKWSAFIQATYDRFLDVVAEGRHLEKSRLEPLARGQVYTGREALKLGLVDELGGQEEAQAWLEKELGGSLEFHDFLPGETDTLGGFLGSLASSAVKASDSPTLRLAAVLDEAAAPWAEAVVGVAARGGGPLVWADLP